MPPSDPLSDLPEAARAVSTAELSDALDALRLPGSALGIGPVAGPARLFGPAFTVRYAPVDTQTPGTVGDYLDDTPAGAVVVLDNGGRRDCTVWGGILSRLAAHRGMAGTVVHGVCRDTAEAAEAGYPLQACGRFMRTGKDRVQVEATQIPVSIGNVRIAPGDLLRGDADGVVAIPRQFEDKVLDSAEQIQQAEDAIRQSVRCGMSLREAREKHRYHQLQTRETA